MATSELPIFGELRDAYQRQVRYLRVSVTDRCNFRCTYCLPASGVVFSRRHALLSFEEIARLVELFRDFGVRRVRLTGGEPTVRADFVELVERLGRIETPDGEPMALAMTTNATRMTELASPLRAAGLGSVNISLDTLRPERFAALTRTGELEQVVAGVEASVAAGLRTKLNIVALRGVNDDELGSLCEWAWARGITPRFIEFMPMSDGELYDGDPLRASEIRAALTAQFAAPLHDSSAEADHGPARYWQLGDHTQKRVGIISAMSEHFCDTCNRVRLSATGQLHTCLAYDDALDLRGLLRHGASDNDIVTAIREALAGKREGHDFQTSGGGAPAKHMISIGG